MRLGADAVISILRRDGRCAMITFDPDTGESNPGVLKRVAVKLSKVCNDLRLLSSGPRAGLGEINLPPMAPGSSIMPGKVNPIIPEVVNQVAFEVIGNDITVTLAAEAGQLELTVLRGAPRGPARGRTGTARPARAARPAAGLPGHHPGTGCRRRHRDLP